MVAVFLFLSQVVAIPAQSSSPQPALLRAYQDLQRLDSTEFLEEVLPEARPLLVVMKHQLVRLIESELNRKKHPDLRAIRQHVLDRLAEQGLKLESLDGNQGYGHIVGLTLETSAGRRDVVVATTSLSINCGADTSLYLFQLKGDRWQLVLSEEASETDGAYGDLQYSLLGLGQKGGAVLVTASQHPCRGTCWGMLRYHVMRVGLSPERPNVLGTGEHAYYRCTDYKLTPEPQGFSLELVDNEDNGDFTPRRLGYRIVDDKVTPDSDR